MTVLALNFLAQIRPPNPLAKHPVKQHIIAINNGLILTLVHVTLNTAPARVFPHE